MNWKEIKTEKAQDCFQEYCATKVPEFSSEYRELRDDLCMLFDTVMNDLGISESEISQKNNSYQLDLHFGIRLYETLNNKYGMNVRLASTAGIWRYISVCVVPDLVEKRYGIDHPDRFWKKPKRLWLRVLWWYIYLSWQGTAQQTINILKDNSTDEILQLVDRCGRGGYRVELYRAIMKKNGELDPVERRRKELFRKMMVLNTARVQVVEPALTDRGEEGYVDSLCDYIMIRATKG